MTEWMYLTSAFAFILLAFQDIDSKMPVGARSPRPGRGNPAPTIKILAIQGFELFLHSALLALLFSLLHKEFPEIRIQEWAPAGLLLGAYLLAEMLRQPPPFFWVSFAMSYTVQSRTEGLYPEACLEALACWVFAVVLLEILVLGLKRRLLFSRPPKAFQGGPVFWILFAVLAAVLGGLPQVFGPLDLFHWEPLPSALQF